MDVTLDVLISRRSFAFTLYKNESVCHAIFGNLRQYFVIYPNLSESAIHFSSLLLFLLSSSFSPSLSFPSLSFSSHVHSSFSDWFLLITESMCPLKEREDLIHSLTSHLPAVIFIMSSCHDLAIRSLAASHLAELVQEKGVWERVEERISSEVMFTFFLSSLFLSFSDTLHDSPLIPVFDSKVIFIF